MNEVHGFDRVLSAYNSWSNDMFKDGVKNTLRGLVYSEVEESGV